jgi:hypothetical protein
MMGMRLAATGVLLLCAMAMQAHAATITVTNTNDSGPGSLRQGLTTANDGDTITFAVTGTITLTSGGLPVTKNLTISGPGADQLSIDGNQALLVLGIFPDKTAAISALTVRNAQVGIWNEQGTLAVSDCAVSGNSGVGVYNHGTLTVSNCVISSNSFGLSNDHATLTVSNCMVTANLYGGIYDNQSHGPARSVDRGTDHCDATKTYDALFGYVSLTIANSVISDNSGSGVATAGGRVTILNSMLSGNFVQGNDGGGISSGNFKSPAEVTVVNSTISGNSASGAGGGGIFADYTLLTIVNSTISGNSADVGGGISVGVSSVSVVNSTVSGNSAGYGGGGISGNSPGLFGGASLIITNSTMSGNSAGTNGGGIDTGTSLEIANSTVSGNSAASGGGIYNEQQSSVEISNTILNAGASGENIVNNGGTVMSHGYNVCSDNAGGYLTGPGDQINTDPLLGPLQDNGGPTLTHAPLPGSPAIDAGDPNFTPPPFHDQRGPCYHRVFGRRIDVGSVETQPRPRCVTPAPRPTPH